MCGTFIEKIKREIEGALRGFLQENGLELFGGSAENAAAEKPQVTLEAIEDTVLSDSRPLFEIKVVLGLSGKADELVKGIYYALHPHNISLADQTVLLMSIQVEEAASQESGVEYKRAMMRYVMEGCLTDDGQSVYSGSGARGSRVNYRESEALAE